MDPQQRQLLEVTYECLENSGIPLEKIRGTRAGCVVANNAVGELRASSEFASARHTIQW